jgi:mRNA-degrading endonuclease toxin of MazEF toxin-antitoxin module
MGIRTTGSRSSRSRQEKKGMIRGVVVCVDLTNALPPEMGKRRPAVIVSNSVQNVALDSVVAVPLSSRAPEIPPLRIKVRASELKTVGYVVVPRDPSVEEEPDCGHGGQPEGSGSGDA